MFNTPAPAATPWTRSPVALAGLFIAHALPRGDRAALLADDPQPWAGLVLADLRRAHPDIHRRVQRIELMRQ